MSKKKGLSAEEKVEKIARWFDAHAEPYTLKELQSLIPKATGVIYQSIDECVEVLVSEDRLQQEKIGVQTFLWKFPLTAAQKQRALAPDELKGKGGNNRAARLALLDVASLKERRNALEGTLNTLNAAIQLRQGEIGSLAESTSDLQKLQTLARRRAELQAELQPLAAFDPEFLDKIKRATALAMDAANRWTENLYLLEDFICHRMGRISKELRASLGIPGTLDYVDDGDLSCGESSSNEATKLKASLPLLLCSASTLSRTEVGEKSNLTSTMEGANGPDDCGGGEEISKMVKSAKNNNGPLLKCCSEVRETTLTTSGITNTDNTIHKINNHKKEEDVIAVDSSTPSHDEDNGKNVETEQNSTDSSSAGDVNPSPLKTNVAKKEPNHSKKKLGGGNPLPKGKAKITLHSSPPVKCTPVNTKGNGKENKSRSLQGGKDKKGVKPSLKVNLGKRANTNGASEEISRKKMPRV
ncbi:unnamed protein product [Phytomonas sp. Hart1]|nr:unnamed protein product [Phytomonas sp. Hart1]|eukprot:CCW66030.1 unnamed protein product [Phytomonas sp. isolate Hart1]